MPGARCAASGAASRSRATPRRYSILSRHSEPHLRHDPALHAQPAPAKKPRTKARSLRTRLFVLDTNVLMHDPASLFRFEEHDVFLPMQTLEELDDHKRGISA